MDTTVTESNITYSTDTGLLYQKLGRLVEKLREKGLFKAHSFVDHTRKAKKLLRKAMRSLRERTGEGRAKFRRILRRLAIIEPRTPFAGQERSYTKQKSP